MTTTLRLAIEGGTPAVSAGPFAWPPPDESVREALLSAYEDGSWGRYEGRHGRDLQSALADMHHTEHVLLTASGTVAVELALRGVGVQPGEEVVLAGYDFAGNFRAIEALGARPVLVDIDPATWCLDSSQLETASTSGATIRAIVASHLHGGLAPMQAIRRFADAHNWAVVEDACQAPGAEVEGRVAGTWGDVGVLSFGGSKLLTAGRGGALITNDATICQRARVYAQRGNDAFPLSELQATVLGPQLEKLADRNTLRTTRVQQLLDWTRPLREQLTPVENAVSGRPAYYKLAWRCQAGDDARSTWIAALQAEGVPIDVGFRGFTRRSARRCRKVGALTASQNAARQTMLLHHTVLIQPEDVIRQVANALDKVVQRLAT